MAMLASIGWYLMTPPYTPLTVPVNQRKLNPVAPYSQWILQEVFDSAKLCEAAKRSNISPLQENPWFYAECIETDDPRLAK
jgi:hypothetical protein